MYIRSPVSHFNRQVGLTGEKTVQNVCIVAALEMGLLQLLAAKQGKSLTAAELANASGYDELFIGENRSPIDENTLY